MKTVAMEVDVGHLKDAVTMKTVAIEVDVEHDHGGDMVEGRQSAQVSTHSNIPYTVC
jgi:predicted thioesterase